LVRSETGLAESIPMAAGRTPPANGHRPREGTHMPADVKRISAAKKVQREATQGGMRAALALEEIADHLEAMRSDALGYHNEVIAALKSLASR
jgi:hypothetical protein